MSLIHSDLESAGDFGILAADLGGTAAVGRGPNRLGKKTGAVFLRREERALMNIIAPKTQSLVAILILLSSSAAFAQAPGQSQNRDQQQTDGSSGPLQGTGPLQGSNPDGSGGPLQGSGPLQGNGPLQ
ncbi:MAG TPA: hypothetical protein VEC60_06420, partial [Reyranella sp.]|nr:hypothetical protein [Reyranella sp.]